jgi:hypothetical protein
MSVNRFQVVLQPTDPPAPAASGFVALPLVGLVTVEQQRFIEEVYRIARERTEAQLRPPARRVAFSLN